MYFGISLNKPPKILVAPLDWGLGHATRCIPVIAALLREGVQVVVAGNEHTNGLLGAEFPQLQYLPLPGYNVTYSKQGWALPFKMLRQLPSVLYRIGREHAWLKQVIREHQLSGVISDNRYGLFSRRVPCIFMTHQLHIQVPGAPLLQRWVKGLNHFFIRRFAACWVPDDPLLKMAGVLSEAGNLPDIHYIGNLSRFHREATEARGLSFQSTYHTVFLLSGPEPQRSVLEQQLVKLSRSWPHRVLLVRGMPMQGTKIECLHAGADQVGHLGASTLEAVLRAAECIVCRSGYSTIMDLVRLGKTAVLIPTPGQTEQEYLAEYLRGMGWFLTLAQKEMTPEAIGDLLKHLPVVDFPKQDDHLLRKTLHEFLQKCTQGS